ncbi:MAG TPA: hypothetical protein DHV52_01725 [Parachlamydiales bacterium]|nr:hypothetical protein [Parachlamydiales bacterium]
MSDGGHLSLPCLFFYLNKQRIKLFASLLILSEAHLLILSETRIHVKRSFPGVQLFLNLLGFFA